MKALVFEHYGKASEVLHLTEVDDVSPAPGEVKVKMLYSPVNPSDVFNTIEGTYRNAVGRAIWNHGKHEDSYTIDPEGQRPLAKLPHIPGLEGVGVVVEAGKGIHPRFLKGKRVTVVGAAKGNWQQFNVVPAKQALPVAKSISDEQAAVSFVNPLTAYAMIREVLNVGKEDIVLQSAANSELGKMIIRLGKHYGFKTINIIRKAEQRQGLLDLGADHVIDSGEQDIQAEVARITNGRGVPFALDPVAGSLAGSMVPCLGLRGRMLLYGTLSNDPVTFSARDIMTPVSTVEGFFLTNFLAGKNVLKILGMTRQVSKLIQQGILISTIDQVYALEQYREAIAHAIMPNNKGKVLFRLND